MSVTVSNCNEICHSPTNQSPSKQLYTFPRQPRFLKSKHSTCDKFYDARDPYTPRATGFGHGHKYDFTRDCPKSPPPTTYCLKSQFDKNEKKGFGFGFSRSEMEVTGPFMAARRDKNPGPGAYELKSSLDSQHAFSLRGKNYQEDHEKLRLPGPGAYPVSFTINQKGQYFLSKYKNSCTRSFNNLTERGKINVNNVPGPGAYPLNKTDFSPEGKYFLSKIKSSQVRKFGTSLRSDIADSKDTPGPGNYRLPSEFGHYLARSAAQKVRAVHMPRIDEKAPGMQKQNA